MRPQLDDSKRRDLVNYRLSRSHNALEEVEYLVKGDYFSSAISRLYYSCYYAAVALLVANKLETQTHAGVKSMLSKHFVKTNKLDSQYAKTFFELFDLRHANDYDDFHVCDKETIEVFIPLAKEFISAVEGIIKTIEVAD